MILKLYCDGNITRQNVEDYLWDYCVVVTHTSGYYAHVRRYKDDYIDSFVFGNIRKRLLFQSYLL